MIKLKSSSLLINLCLRWPRMIKILLLHLSTLEKIINCREAQELSSKQAAIQVKQVSNPELGSWNKF